MKLVPGAKFDRFTVEGLLGEGGMGQVYRAFDERLQRRVALKILRPRASEEGGADRGDRNSLILREARAAAALDHPNAVSVFELGEHEGTPFMAMELISGAPLRALIGRKDVPVEQRLLWLLDIARALEAAHKAGIVHLDVKPENVMVRGDGVVKVLDFGIARHTDFVPDPGDAASWENARSTALTQGSALVGTVPYMAPEQVRRQPVDGRTDQFAWGVVGYELCTGSLPWPTSGTAYDLISAILTKTPEAVSAVSTEVPSTASAVVMRALAKAPDDRFPDMGEAVAALTAALGGAPTTRGARPLPKSLVPPDEETRRRLSRMLTESSHLSHDLAAQVSALSSASSPAPPSVSTLTTGATAPVSTDLPSAGLAAVPTQRSEGTTSAGEGAAPRPAENERGPDTDALSGSERDPAQRPDDARGPETEDLPSDSPQEAAQDAGVAPSLKPVSSAPRSGAATRRSAGADASAQASPSSPRVRVEHREGPGTPAPSSPARPERPSSKAPRKVPLEIVWTALAVVVALGVLLWGRGPAATTQPTAAPSASASARPTGAEPSATTPTPITALPAPTDCNAAALAEYKAGVQALHDGIWEHAHRAFGRAIAADDHCAEAFLRRVQTGHALASASEARELYLRAVELRGQLSERDRGLLHAYEPLVRSDPANHRACRERLAELAARFPGDAEIAYLNADQDEDPARALESAERALRVDPTYSDAWQTKGRALVKLGRTKEALAVLDQCLAAAPNSVDCVRESITHLRRMGRCDDMAKAARAWIARDPSSASGYQKLAEAIASSDGPREAVSEALRQSWANLDERGRAQRERFEGALLDALGGDFEAAAERSEALSRLVDADPNYEPHVRQAFLELGLLTETGQRDRAAAVAAEFLKRKAAWASTLTPDSLDVAVYSFEPRLLAAARQAGLSPPAFTHAADAWAATTKDAGILDEEVVWAFRVALPAETPAEATAALASMPARLLAGDGYLRAPSELAGAFVGHALLLAGRADEAVSFLRVATRSCYALDDPFVHTRASLWLGEALETQKDKDGACAAYRRVEGRWQKARPRSVTAEEARRRADALKCPR